MKLLWDCDGQVSPFTIYRSGVVFDKDTLPDPLVSDISGTTTYIDETSDEFYYLVKSEYDDKVFYSGQVKTIKDIPGHFVVDINYNYIPSYGGAVNFAVQI